MVKPVLNQYQRAHRIWLQCASQLVPEIHPSQAPIIGAIAMGGTCSQAVLTKHMGVSPAAVAVSLKRLEKQGLVMRQVNPMDQRENLLNLTPAGKRAAHALEEAMMQVKGKAVEGIQPEQLTQLLQLLQQVSNNLENFHAALVAAKKGDEI